jgi:hypothetical protein
VKELPYSPATPADYRAQRFETARAMVARICREPAGCKHRGCRRTGRCAIIADLDHRKAEAEAEERGRGILDHGSLSLAKVGGQG